MAGGGSKNPVLDTEIVSMDEHDRYEMRRCISLALAKRPYSACFMVMDYVPKPFPEDGRDPNQPIYMDIPPFMMFDKVEACIIANEQVSDWELHDFIVASGGKIIDIYNRGLQEKRQNVVPETLPEFKHYEKEINFFLERISLHPTMVEIKSKQRAIESNPPGA